MPVSYLGIQNNLSEVVQMEKRLIVSTSCANEFASDVPELFTIVIDDGLSARIRFLANSVKELGVVAPADPNHQDTVPW